MSSQVMSHHWLIFLGILLFHKKTALISSITSAYLKCHIHTLSHTCNSFFKSKFKTIKSSGHKV